MVPRGKASMKNIYKIIINLMVASMLIFAQTGMAAAENKDEMAEIAEAKTLYAKALPMDVNSPERAKVLDQAAAILKDVIKKNPQSLDAHRKLMGVYLLKQDYSRAIRTVQDAITISPNDPKLFITLAFMYEHSGAFEFAKAMLDQALALDPNQELAKEYKVAIQQKIDKRNEDMHLGRDVTGNPHGKAKGPSSHTKPMGTTHPPAGSTR